MKKFLKRVLDAGTIGLLFQGTVVQFQGLTGSSNNTNALGTLSGFFNSSSCSGSSCLAGFFQGVFTMALTVGAILAVLRLAYAGWLYMGAADMWGSKQKAKDVIFNAILGLLLLFSIWIVLNQINPSLLNLNIVQTVQSNQVQSSTGSIGGSSALNCTGSNSATCVQ